MKSNKVLVVIVGPTAVGKTAVAIRLAKRLNTVIISADSRQIFRELNIGTAKPSAAELSEVPHYFINSHSIRDEYDAAAYGRDALQLLEQLHEKHDRVIMSGGSGLYIKAVCEGFDAIPDVDPGIRADLVDHYGRHGLEWLQKKMEELDPNLFATMDRLNPHRLIRALEVRIGTGQSIASFRKNARLSHTFDIIKIGLELPRDELYRRIDERMDAMIAAGLFQEAESLYPMRHLNSLQTVGYQEIFDYLDGKYAYDEAIRLLKRNSRRYAKRQLTWFKRDHEIQWFHPLEVDDIMNEVTQID